jgi:hypothetical protein
VVEQGHSYGLRNPIYRCICLSCRPFRKSRTLLILWSQQFPNSIPSTAFQFKVLAKPGLAPILFT